MYELDSRFRGNDRCLVLLIAVLISSRKFFAACEGLSGGLRMRNLASLLLGIAAIA